MTVPECTDCGACCHSDDPHWIQVFEVDARRMDPPATRLTHHLDGRRFMRFAAGRCEALVIGDGARCSIYEQRPDACRWLTRGSSTCRAILAARLGQDGSSVLSPR